MRTLSQTVGLFSVAFWTVAVILFLLSAQTVFLVMAPFFYLFFLSLLLFANSYKNSVCFEEFVRSEDFPDAPAQGEFRVSPDLVGLKGLGWIFTILAIYVLLYPGLRDALGSQTTTPLILTSAVVGLACLGFSWGTEVSVSSRQTVKFVSFFGLRWERKRTYSPLATLTLHRTFSVSRVRKGRTGPVRVVLNQSNCLEIEEFNQPWIISTDANVQTALMVAKALELPGLTVKTLDRSGGKAADEVNDYQFSPERVVSVKSEPKVSPTLLGMMCGLGAVVYVLGATLLSLAP